MKRPFWLQLLLLSFLAASSARAESFSAWVAKAERLEKKKETEQAVGAYSQALHLWKKSDGRKAKAKAYAARAALYEKEGDFSDAIKDYSSAVSLSTNTASYFHRRGRAYLKVSKTSEAITDFYKATRLNPNLKEAYSDRASAYEAQGDSKFAREDYRTACRLGLKRACAPAAASKPKQAPHAAVLDVFEAPKEAAKAVEVKPAKPEKRPAAKLDFGACLSGLDACVEQGSSFGACVKDAKVCEQEPKKGCCPQACVKQFDRQTDADKSEAEAFREIFVPKSKCAAPDL